MIYTANAMNKTSKPLFFPLGYLHIHDDASINFQMNRFSSWTGDPTMFQEMQAVAPRIKDYADYKRELLALAEQALQNENPVKAAYYFRAAEFYIFADDPDKEPVRKRFLELIRGAFKIDQSVRFLIPYEAGYLPAYRFAPEQPKGHIVFFGGFDSYIEELFPLLLFIRDAGYDIVCFDGPGQGAALEEFHLPMTHEWEKPVRTVLDYFNLEDVTLIGLSLGGCLAIRAAAYEPRVRRVVTDDILTDFYEVMMRQTNPMLRSALRMLVKVGAVGLVNTLLTRSARRRKVVEWGIKQGMHVMGVETPFQFLRSAMNLNTRRVSPLVTQDVLLMAGAEDHYVPVHQFHDQIRRLTAARSITARLFTAHEHAQNHCQVGNLGLSVQVMLNWIAQFPAVTEISDT